MSAATTPSQLFLQAAALGGNWSQAGQQMQFSRERAGVADQNALRDDELRRQQWAAQQQQYRDRIAQEAAQRDANATILKMLLAPDADPIQPQGPGAMPVMPVPDLRAQVSDSMLQHASPGLSSLLASRSFDRQGAAKEYNRVSAAVNELMLGNRLSLSPDMVKKAQDLGIDIPFEHLPRGMRDQIQYEDAGVKGLMLSDMGIAEGSPEWDRFMAGDRAGSGLNERHSRWQKKQIEDANKRGLLAQLGVQEVVQTPLGDQPNPDFARLFAMKPQELEGVAQRMVAEKKQAESAASMQRFAGIVATRNAGGQVSPEDQAWMAMQRNLSATETREPKDNSVEAANFRLSRLKDVAERKRLLFKDAEDEYVDEATVNAARAEWKAAEAEYLSEAQNGARVAGSPEAVTQQPNPENVQVLKHFAAQLQQQLGRMPTRDELKQALQQAGIQVQPSGAGGQR